MRDVYFNNTNALKVVQFLYETGIFLIKSFLLHFLNGGKILKVIIGEEVEYT